MFLPNLFGDSITTDVIVNQTLSDIMGGHHKTVLEHHKLHIKILKALDKRNKKGCFEVMIEERTKER